MRLPNTAPLRGIFDVHALHLHLRQVQVSGSQGGLVGLPRLRRARFGVVCVA